MHRHWLSALIVFTLLGVTLGLDALAVDKDTGGRKIGATVWPQFRGPGALGIAENSNLPDTWSATENVAWKTEIPGLGWSSPIVWGNRVFVTTVVNEAETEEPKKGLYFGGNRAEPRDTIHHWIVYCLDLNSGEVVWEQESHSGIPESVVHLKNTFASETPVTDGERVYAYFGNVGIFAYDFDGKQVWSKRFKPQPTRYGWGTASSPVLHGDRIYIVSDTDGESFLVALDKLTGDEIWRVPRDEKSNWATPYVWENELRTEIITPGTGKVRSYDLDGNLLWEFGGMSSITIATPYSKFGLAYISSGYVMDKRKPIFAVRPGASGDISLGDDETTSEYVQWCQKKAGAYNPSTVIHGDKLFVLLDRGFFACYDAKTGDEIYGRQRLPNGKAFTSSPWAYNGKIFCVNEDGVTFVIAASDEFEILHTNALEEDDMCMATPAIVGDKLLIRTDRRLYCIQNK